MIERLHLRNFTAFEDLELTFSSGVNVLIGGNGTGKTHVLKAIYGTYQALLTKNKQDYFSNLFMPVAPKLSNLIRNNKFDNFISCTIDDRQNLLYIKNSLLYSDDLPIKNYSLIFFPAHDMIGHSRGLRSLMKRYKMDFDQTYRDIIDLAFMPQLVDPNPSFSEVRKKLSKIMHGYKPQVDEDQYYLVANRKQIDIRLAAEGWRKIALLYYILENHPDLKAGDVILWDEPEANLNPVALRGLVECLADLSKLGLQIFIATHSYVLLKELEIYQAKDLQFISLYQTEDHGVKASVATRYEDIEHNLIEQENERLYYAEIGLPLEEASDDDLN